MARVLPSRNPPVKIARHLDSAGEVGYASDGKKITGDIGKFAVTNEETDAKKALARRSQPYPCASA